MSDKIIMKIIDHEAKKLLQTALLVSDSKEDAKNILTEIWDEALRQLWKDE